MEKYILIVLCAIFTMSCAGNDAISQETSMESTLIYKGNLYGAGDEGIDKQHLVISDTDTWDNLIAKMNTTNKVSDNFSETEIDFSKFIVIAVFNEVKSNGGYSLDLKITSNSENVIVKVTDQSPKGYATTVMTQPFHIVKIPKTDLEVIFE